MGLLLGFPTQLQEVMEIRLQNAELCMRHPTPHLQNNNAVPPMNRHALLLMSSSVLPLMSSNVPQATRPAPPSNAPPHMSNSAVEEVGMAVDIEERGVLGDMEAAEEVPAAEGYLSSHAEVSLSGNLCRTARGSQSKTANTFQEKTAREFLNKIADPCQFRNQLRLLDKCAVEVMGEAVDLVEVEALEAAEEAVMVEDIIKTAVFIMHQIDCEIKYSKHL